MIPVPPPLRLEFGTGVSGMPLKVTAVTFASVVDRPRRRRRPPAHARRHRQSHAATTATCARSTWWRHGWPHRRRCQRWRKEPPQGSTRRAAWMSSRLSIGGRASSQSPLGPYPSSVLKRDCTVIDAGRYVDASVFKRRSTSAVSSLARTCRPSSCLSTLIAREDTSHADTRRSCRGGVGDPGGGGAQPRAHGGSGDRGRIIVTHAMIAEGLAMPQASRTQ
jgi:hypothetical protein